MATALMTVNFSLALLAVLGVTACGDDPAADGGFPTAGAEFACLDEHQQGVQNYCWQFDTKAADAEAECLDSNIGTGTPFDGPCPNVDSQGRSAIGYCSGGLALPAGTPNIVVIYPPFGEAEATTFCTQIPGAMFVPI